MSNPFDAAAYGNFPDANSPTPVYYANFVSNLILKDLRTKIDKIIDAELAADDDSGTRLQIMAILFSRNAEIAKLMGKVFKINAWYDSLQFPGVSIINNSDELQEGKSFEFEPNDKHNTEYPEHKPKNGKVKGTNLVPCSSGFCCTEPTNAVSSYFMVPSSSADNFKGYKLEETVENGAWHIYEANNGTPFNINIGGENYDFTV